MVTVVVTPSVSEGPGGWAALAMWIAASPVPPGPSLTLGVTALAAYVAMRLRSRVLAWAVTAASLVAAERSVRDAVPILRMVVLVVTLMCAMKGVVGASEERLAPKQWLAFQTWLGMRPRIFATLGGPPCSGTARLARDGALFVAAGVALFFTRTAVTVMIAYSLVVHFGFTNLGAAFWRRFGVPADRLFRNPLQSSTLADFWGRRWNLGFAQMTSTAIYRPIRAKVGETPALLGSFVASGIFHELAISLPVRAGYGLPTLYFLAQGLLVIAEKRGLLGAPSRVRTLALLALPAPILFHPWFVKGIVCPLL